MNNPNLRFSLLVDPEQLPSRPFDAHATQWRSTLIVAPHQDDESLGCGGLIRMLRDANLPCQVLFVSDGSRSHPNSADYPPPRLAAVRRQEALDALQLLGVDAANVHFLDLQDGAVPARDADGFADAVERVAAYLEQWQPATVATPWRRDPHRDHVATTQIVRAAVADAGLHCRLLEYPIWVWEARAENIAPTGGEVCGWRLPIAAVLDCKRQAIRAHRSQTTDLIKDDPDGFTLTHAQIARFTTDYEIYFEDRHKRVDRSTTLPRDYFEDKYAAKKDPWRFASSEYEQQKYERTLAALPRPCYASTFEIGCSIGVLTEKLAARTRRLLAVDTSQRALAAARERCRFHPHVCFAQMQIPQQWPQARFDLIIMSEVGYYLSTAALRQTQQQIIDSLCRGGQLLLVHWTPMVADYPLTGDEVHDHFLQCARLRHQFGERHSTYRLDLFALPGS